MTLKNRLVKTKLRYKEAIENLDYAIRMWHESGGQSEPIHLSRRVSELDDKMMRLGARVTSLEVMLTYKPYTNVKVYGRKEQ
jgi:hypothetical protein